ASGTTPANVGITINASGLKAGTYQSSIVIAAANVTPPSRTVTVTLTVDPAPPPQLSFAPGGLFFGVFEQSNVATQVLNVNNRSAQGLPFQMTAVTNAGGGWLSLSTGAGTASASSPVPVTVMADSTGLALGIYTG